MTKKRITDPQELESIIDSAESNKGFTDEENAPDLNKYAGVHHKLDKRLEELFEYADDDKKFFYVNPKNDEIRMRVLSVEENIYSEELFQKYVADVGLSTMYNTDFSQVIRLAYLTAIRLCISGCSMHITRGMSLQSISQNSCLELGAILKAPPSVLLYLDALLAKNTQKFNPTIEELGRDDILEYVEAIKKQKIAIVDLSYQTITAILKGLIEGVELEGK